MKLGSKENPYNYSVYESMVANQTWTGGWVRDSSTSEVYYITSSGSVEHYQNGYVLGSIDNPFSHVAYTEMYAAETWPGGYVLDPDNIARYYHRYYGSSGCGCETGCGCGCGCGCGNINALREGSANVSNYSISWGNGTFTATSKPSIVVRKGGVSIPADWSLDYQIRINYGSNPVFYFNIPDQYRYTI